MLGSLRPMAKRVLLLPITLFYRQSRRGRKPLLVALLLSLASLLWACSAVVTILLAGPPPEKLPLHRDLYAQEDWAEISRDDSLTPDQVPSTVHYLWCGKHQFHFQHYLGVLSVIRLLQPLHIVFHYTHLPEVDDNWYNVWFQELQQSFANLDLVPLVTDDPCGSTQLLATALDFLAPAGGIYVGENVILTRYPSHSEVTRTPFWFAFADASVDATRGVVFARQGFSAAEAKEYLRDIMASGSRCTHVDGYNRLGLSQAAAAAAAPCIALVDKTNPKDVWAAETPFAELARWLFYGRREPLHAKPSPQNSIPRVAHLLWLHKDGVAETESNVFEFSHYLSVLSALHVAGLRHVHVHGDYEPRGEWWEALRGENVTFVRLDTPKHVFQQWVSTPTHRSDIIRVHILQTYGGVYQDRDVLWVQELPDWLLHYPAVLCPDWPFNGEWPETFNLGVMMAQRQSAWLRHFIASLRLFLTDSWAFNAIFMPYRVLEWHPDTLYVDRYLQVICNKGTCHPTWYEDYQQQNPESSHYFDWQEARAFHFVYPKPNKMQSLASMEDLRTGNDVLAKITRAILVKSGREALLLGDA